MTHSLGRRTAMALGGAAALAGRARAQAGKEVKIAMLVPLTGPWARQGILERMGAEMAIDDVNAAGGIKALGGAKLKLLVIDTGRFRGEGERRGAAHAGAGTRPGRRHRLLAEHVHAGRHRGQRTRAASVADAVLFRRHHQPRLPLRVSDLTDRRQAGHRCRADHHETGFGHDGQAADQGRHHRRQHRGQRQLPANRSAIIS